MPKSLGLFGQAIYPFQTRLLHPLRSTAAFRPQYLERTSDTEHNQVRHAMPEKQGQTILFGNPKCNKDDTHVVQAQLITEERQLFA